MLAKLRPRLRFSLRTLLVLTTVLCLWFGYVVKRTRDQAALAAFVHQCSGHVDYDRVPVGLIGGTSGVFKPQPSRPWYKPAWPGRFLGRDFVYDIGYVSVDL